MKTLGVIISVVGIMVVGQGILYHGRQATSKSGIRGLVAFCVGIILYTIGMNLINVGVGNV